MIIVSKSPNAEYLSHKQIQMMHEPESVVYCSFDDLHSCFHLQSVYHCMEENSAVTTQLNPTLNLQRKQFPVAWFNAHDL